MISHSPQNAGRKCLRATLTPFLRQRHYSIVLSVIVATTALPSPALDANQNGLSDVWESLYPTAASSPDLDSDQDGFSNREEALGWSNPDDSLSNSHTHKISATNGTLRFEWQTQNWMRYRVRQSTSLSNWTWSYTPLTGNGNTNVSITSASSSQAFQQIQVLPALNSDTDALDNLEESILGTNPQDWDTDNDKVGDDAEFQNGTNPLTTQDTDGDGLPDDWEQWIIKANTNDAVTTLAHVTHTTDYDGDGINEGTEFNLGTSPIKRRQNILFFLTEDQSYHLGCLGTVGLDTPRLDSLGTNGLIFKRAFAGSPVCSPAKMSIYTGTHPHHNSGFRNVSNYPEGAFPLPTNVAAQYNDEGVHEDLPTYVEILNDRGWFTAVSHKVHVEPVRKYPFKKGYGQPSTPATATSYLNDVVTSAGNRPFYMTFNIGSPHLPFRSIPNANGQWSGSGGLTGDGRVLNVDANAIEVPGCYPDVPGVRQDIADYYGAIEMIDSIFGAVVDALAANGQLTNTLIVFTGDHGIGLHRAKQSCYGLGLHVPLLVSGPGMSGKRQISAPVSHTDIAPTFVDFAGLPKFETMTGKSLLPMVRGDFNSFPDRATVLAASHHRYDARAVCDGRYYYIRNLRNVTGASLANPGNAMNADSYQATSPYFNRTYNATVAATGTLQRQLLADLVNGNLPPEELYDMDADLWMTNNLISAPGLQGTVNFLRSEMAQWRMYSEDYNTNNTELVRRTVRFDPPSNVLTVSAGPNQSALTTNTIGEITLNGYVSNPLATSLWSKVSGPGTVAFGNPAALATTATLNGLGTYELQLNAGTTNGSATDTLTVLVTEPAAGNLLLNSGAEGNTLGPWLVNSTGTDAGTGGGWSTAAAAPRLGAYAFRWDDNLWVSSTGTLSQSVTTGIQGGVSYNASVQVAAEQGSGGLAPSHAITLRIQWYADAGLTTLLDTHETSLTTGTGLSASLSLLELANVTPVGAQAVRFTIICTHTNPPDASKTNFVMDDASLVLTPEE